MQSLGQSSVTSRCSPQHCGQMRPWTAGQKRFSLRMSQMAQLKLDVSSPTLCTEGFVGSDHERLVGLFASPRFNPSGTHVWAISGCLPVNKHVIMPTSACNLCGTRVK